VRDRLYDISSNPDEFVGLRSTFMQLGAAGVLATLWQVDDLATSLLLAKFYDLHLGSGLAPPTALRQAQQWLRTASKDELIVYARSTRLDPARLAELESEIKTRRRGSALAAVTRSLQRDTLSGTLSAPADQPAVPAGATHGPPPFRHPYFWGGFVYTGL
jgi:CHAT domain-containing protein